jgi:hypothetical protein
MEGASMREVNIHIEELILHGYDPLLRGQIAAAVERELARLVGEQGPPFRLTSNGDLGRQDAGAFDAPAGASPEAVGTHVARALYRSLGR